MTGKTLQDLFKTLQDEPEIEEHPKSTQKKKRQKTTPKEVVVDDKKSFIGYETHALSLNEPSEKISVTQSNDLVSASYKLSLDAKRLLLLAISKINPMVSSGVNYDDEGIPSLNRPRIKVHAKEWEAYYGTDTRVYSRLKTAMNDLYNSSAVIFKDDVSGRECRWIDEKYYHDGDGCIEIQLTSRVTSHLTMLMNTFTTYKLLNVGGLRSIHSIRIYEIIAQFKSTGFRKILIPDLKKALGLEPSSYLRFNDFKRRVIEHAIEEINEKTDFKVTYSLEKKGRKIHAINFFLEMNPNPPLNFVK